MSEDKMTVEKFIEKLAIWDHREINGLESFDIINMYNEAYVSYLKEKKQELKNISIDNWCEKAKIKQKNLHFYLNKVIKKMKELNPPHLFVGEAPGRWGCFQSGIPFTDINVLVENDFFKERRDELNKKKEELIRLHIASSKEKISKNEISERSSTVVWGCLNELFMSKKEEFPLFWNIYPFYPYFKCDKYTLPNGRPNRTPNADEKGKGFEILLDFLELFQDFNINIDRIYAVGHEAEKTLKSVKVKKIIKDRKIKKVLVEKFTNITYLYHPAYAGGSKFRDQFRDIYNLKTNE